MCPGISVHGFAMWVLSGRGTIYGDLGRKHDAISDIGQSDPSPSLRFSLAPMDREVVDAAILRSLSQAGPRKTAW